MKATKLIITVLLSTFLGVILIAQNITTDIVKDSINFTRGEATYSGTLSKPAGEGVFPLVVMVSGMGQQDRDWSFMGGKYKLAKIISDYLNQNGIAVYRYDDRGTAKSTGSPETLTSFDDLAEDVYAVVKKLKARDDIGKVGLLGHSLGGLLSLKVGANHEDLDFIITLSGSYQNGGDVMMEQAQTLKRWRTSDEMTEEEVVANGERFVRNWISYSNGGEGLDTMNIILSELIHYQIRSLSPEQLAENLEVFKDTTELYEKSYEGVVAYYTSPHQMSFASYDPIEDFKKITCPILVLFGENDNHVTVASNLPGISEALPDAAFSDLTIRIIPLADHGYSSSDYIQKGEMVPGVVDFIANWVNYRK